MVLPDANSQSQVTVLNANTELQSKQEGTCHLERPLGTLR